MMKLIAMLSGVALVAGCGLPAETNHPVISEDEFMKLVYQEPDTGLYIANGDEVYETKEDLLNEVYYPVMNDLARSADALAVMTSGGKDVKWVGSAALNITYCVSTKFGSRYTTVVNAMESATGAWEAAANVNFIHVASQDSNCTNRNGNVVFDVNPVNTTQYLARAFFPNSSRRSRNVLIDDSAFGSNPDINGVLRHELGHTIGFRHEHTRPEAGTCFEDNNWRALTAYDKASVMHYPQCNGINSWALTLTSLDKQGAAALYPR